MNLLGAKLYDPAAAVSKATSSLLAMTAIDTTNLRLAITVPAHGMVRFRLRGIITGATTCPTIFLGVMNGATVLGRVSPAFENATANAATQNFLCDAEFTVTGLTPGAMNVDAAYGVEVVVAATNIKYGGPNDTTTNNAWGGFLFEAWDPQPLTLALDGGVNVTQWKGNTVPATNVNGVPIVDNKYLLGTIYSTPGTAGIKEINVLNWKNATAPAMTGDAFARLGAPAGASVSADVAAVKSDTGAIKASQILATGTATAGAASTITLQNALGADWLPVGCRIALTGGTGIGQCRVITGYVNATKVTTVGHAWTTNPDATSVYYIIFNDAPKVDSSLKVAGVVLTDTVTTYTGNTPQTGDAFARLGAPAGASVSADVAAVNAKTTNLPAAPASTTNITAGTITTATNVTTVNGLAANVITAASINAAALNGKGDWNIGKTGYALSGAGVQAIWDALTSALTTVGSIGKKLADWTIGTAQTGDSYARLGAPAGASISADIAAAKVDTAAIKLKTDNLPASPAAVGSAMTLTSGERTAIANEVEAQIIDDTDSEKVLQAIVDKIAAANPSLDDLTLGAIASAVRAELTTELGRIDVAISTRLATAGYTAPLDAAGVRTAVGLATANLDTQLDALPTNAEFASGLGALNNLSAAQAQTAAAAALTAYDPPTRTEATADKNEIIVETGLIKAQTDQLSFGVTGKVDANMTHVNEIEITGDGESGTEFGPA